MPWKFAHAEQLLNINNAHAADLHIVANDLGGSTDQHIVDAANFHSIVSHQLMTAL